MRSLPETDIDPNFLVLRECLPHHILFEKFLTNSNLSFNGT